MSGSAGSTSPPTAEMTTRAVTVSSRWVVSVQTPASSSKRASTISVPRRIFGRSVTFVIRIRRSARASVAVARSE